MRQRSRSTVALATLVVALWAVAQPMLGAASGVVNINDASLDQLMLLPRVGPAVASRIVEFREQNGRFKQATDLLLVKGIGDKTFALIEPYVTVSGETTLKEKVSVAREGDSSSGR